MRNNLNACLPSLFLSILIFIVSYSFAPSDPQSYGTFKTQYNEAYENLRSLGWKEFLRRNGWPFPWLCFPCLPCVYLAKKGQEKDMRRLSRKCDNTLSKLDS